MFFLLRIGAALSSMRKEKCIYWCVLLVEKSFYCMNSRQFVYFEPICSRLNTVRSVFQSDWIAFRFLYRFEKYSSSKWKSQHFRYRRRTKCLMSLACEFFSSSFGDTTFLFGCRTVYQVGESKVFEKKLYGHLLSPASHRWTQI